MTPDQIPAWLDDRLPAHDRCAIVEVGSTAHGAAEAGYDDFDCAVVWVETPEQVFSLDQVKPRRMVRTKPEGERSEAGDVDAQVYSLRTWLNLAAKGNPSVLQTLWCPELETDNRWRALQDGSALFIGRHLLGPYRGYMKSQVERLVGKRGGGHGIRGSGGRPELIERYGYDTKFAMHATRLGLQCRELLTTGRLVLPVPGEDGALLRRIRHGEIPFDDWFELTIDLDHQLGATRWDVPDGPDREAIGTLSHLIHLGRVSRESRRTA